MKSFSSALALFLAIIIGGGIFALPYAISRIGFFPGVIFIILIALILLFVYRAYAEVIIATPERMQYPGYVERYLGKKIKKIAFLSVFLGSLSALSAYLLGIGSFAQNIIGGQPKIWSWIFFAFAALVIYKGIKPIARIEKILMYFIFSLVLIILFYSLPSIKIENLLTFHPKEIFFPYGAIFFALGGASALPDALHLLKKDKKQTRRLLPLGLGLASLAYILFVFSIMGMTGENTPENALHQQGDINNHLLLLGSMLGIFTMGTSFLSLGLILKEVFFYDFHVPHFFSWILTLLPPFLLLIFQTLSFIHLISIGGAIISGIDGILILTMYQKIKGNLHPFLLPLAYLLFGFGILYQIWSVFS